jgi:hypothetical protein
MQPPETPDGDIRLYELIEAQRKLANSTQPYEQVIARLWVTGTLTKRLAQLSDNQIGHLLSDVVLHELNFFSPAVAICEAASQRLLRLTGGKLPPGRATTNRNQGAVQTVIRRD